MKKIIIHASIIAILFFIIYCGLDLFFSMLCEDKEIHWVVNAVSAVLIGVLFAIIEIRLP